MPRIRKSNDFARLGHETFSGIPHDLDRFGCVLRGDVSVRRQLAKGDLLACRGGIDGKCDVLAASPVFYTETFDAVKFAKIIGN